MSATDIISDWLKQVQLTVAECDHAAHMNLIPENVSLLGVAGFDNIGFHECPALCQHELTNNLIGGIKYADIKEQIHVSCS